VQQNIATIELVSKSAEKRKREAELTANYARSLIEASL
jgi:hypothetical protein